MNRYLLSCLSLVCLTANSLAAEPPVDFTTEVRPLLSNKCFACHGPDEEQRQSGLRLDDRSSATSELDSGAHAIVPGKPDWSELIARVTADDESLRMPPAEFGAKLTAKEVELLKRWITQEAPFAEHWSYARPNRPQLPAVPNSELCRNEIDYFVQARLAEKGLGPPPEADRRTLIRRVALDLTGLPPTAEEVATFVNNSAPDAYEQVVDHFLQKPAYGEHWARKWLDLARYADSAGYADDPPRTIWAYRDWVIKAINENMPFDQFTVEQIAGDMLPMPSDSQLIATAFHRNTLTNNEGGTNDEEFRNVAIVDRVNTTMATWMGTTINCAQCHNHKYDPISQEEFYRLFAILNNTQDADRRDESPLLEVYTDEQRQQKQSWEAEQQQLETVLATMTLELRRELAEWDASLKQELNWESPRINGADSKEQAKLQVIEDQRVLVEESNATDVLTLKLQVTAVDEQSPLQAIQLQTFPHESLPAGGSGFGGGNFVITSVKATIVPQGNSRPSGRYVRVAMPGQKQFLSLAEVQVFSGNENVALKGEATQSSTDYDGPAKFAIDGNTDGEFTKKSTTHTAQDDSPWWEVDLKASAAVDRIAVWNRTDGNVGNRLNNYTVQLLDENRNVVWSQTVEQFPNPSQEFAPSGARELQFAAAYADYEQPSFGASGVLATKDPNNSGWAVGGATTEPHTLTLVPSSPVQISSDDIIELRIEQLSKHTNHTVGQVGVRLSRDARAASLAQVPANILNIARLDAAKRNPEQQQTLEKHFLENVAPSLAMQRERLAAVRKLIAEQKPATTVPIYRELAENQLRKTNIQIRGNFMALGKEVSPGVPKVFGALPEGAEPNRLGLAQWLIAESNPLTPRVIANRYWEAIFGRGLVSTSEEFGSQGQLPTHPHLLDWLAVELVESGWNTKALVRKIVTSATYRQSSAVTTDLLELDPDNSQLSRGPRVRLTAEMVRDQALAVSGLLSDKMYGPPVKPPQPSLGLNAAFGSGIDWQTSDGDDKYRRGLYTTWRRSNPYPSMATFDAPNREVCTVRRTSTNTPLQALVTLNDPVYIEAAQSLARKIAQHPGDASEQARFGIETCLVRSADDAEVEQLVQLFNLAREHFASREAEAKQLATVPLGNPPEGLSVTDLAAWTAVSNVLLNLDEFLMKP
ncbi:MAG: DUF1553 domain-containing protein [Planctomycetaceae bacterium]|nr:DUF1553 domain-containing protein [Planctomycetaceae bacterium]